MIRAFHRWPGLLALLLVTLLALSGAALSVFPAAERFSAPQAAAGLSVAELAARIEAVHPGVEQIRRSPSGRITASWTEGDAPGEAVIDPATGQAVAAATPSGFESWLKDLHRSLFLGDGGRLVMAAGAVAMLILSMSGVMLVARRNGGWRRWFSPVRGPLSARLHVEIARIAVAGLILSSVTALWMTAATFDLLPGQAGMLAIPAASGQTGADPAHMQALAATPVDALRELTFPLAGDVTDVFTLKTAQGSGYIDQGTGEVLAWAAPTPWEKVSGVIYMLHTGQGAASLGLVLGLLALGVPAMGVTGFAMWFAARRGRPRIRGNATAAKAETILLVGSEGGSTWGFAATLHKALRAAGQAVHVAPMSAFAPERYTHARRILVLTATYGDGDAPQSARGFMEKLRTASPLRGVPLAVLGFGDSAFPHFCAFASEMAELAADRGWAELVPFDAVDRQSPQAFARWGWTLGEALGINLELVHHRARPVTAELTLVSRRDYGAEVQAPSAILRFATPKLSLWQRLTGQGFARFSAGDLLGIVPAGSDVPRFYSLASGRKDGFIEIVVRKHPGGLCSGQLMELEPGDSVSCFIKANPAFRPGRGKAPLILIGAGTGIGPLAGFIRANEVRRPVHLFFGMRHAASDFLYGGELTHWYGQGRLTALVTAASRGNRPHYVQDAVWSEAAAIAGLIRAGARVMVCGGRDMASGVAEVLADILAPAGLSLAKLKAEGRYAEDVY